MQGKKLPLNKDHKSTTATILGVPRVIDVHRFDSIWNGKCRFTKIKPYKSRKYMHRPGIEPGPPAWQASILPLNQRCFDSIVIRAGFKPPTPKKQVFWPHRWCRSWLWWPCSRRPCCHSDCRKWWWLFRLWQMRWWQTCWIRIHNSALRLLIWYLSKTLKGLSRYVTLIGPYWQVESTAEKPIIDI